jgi:erythrocyte band 7 integral membrane protein
VYDYEQAVIFRMGKLRSKISKDSGAVFNLPCVDTFYKIDLRVVTFDVPPQEVFNYPSSKLSE